MVPDKPYVGRRDFVYLAYLDDSDTKQKSHKWQVMSAVVVKDSEFRNLEIIMSVVADILLPSKRGEFTEFHACELYGGYGIFDGIEQAKRFDAIRTLLSALRANDFPVIYGAVDLERLKNMMYASADPLDIAFRVCASGVDQWLNKTINERFKDYGVDDIERLMADNLVLFIADDCTPKSKASMQQSFRGMRISPLDYALSPGKICNVHDDMYFGDSKFSVGIQLADLCSYFIARHLDNDESVDGFYKMIEPHIVYSQSWPEEGEHAATKESVIGGR
jgi:hypothetical protein